MPNRQQNYLRQSRAVLVGEIERLRAELKQEKKNYRETKSKLNEANETISELAIKKTRYRHRCILFSNHAEELEEDNTILREQLEKQRECRICCQEIFCRNIAAEEDESKYFVALSCGHRVCNTCEPNLNRICPFCKQNVYAPLRLYDN